MLIKAKKNTFVSSVFLEPGDEMDINPKDFDKDSMEQLGSRPAAATSPAPPAAAPVVEFIPGEKRLSEAELKVPGAAELLKVPYDRLAASCGLMGLKVSPGQFTKDQLVRFLTTKPAEAAPEAPEEKSEIPAEAAAQGGDPAGTGSQNVL